MPDMRDIIRAGLTALGYDGLFYAGECGCDMNDLIACNHIGEGCEPGFRVCPPESKDAEDYYITGIKPVSAEGQAMLSAPPTNTEIIALLKRSLHLAIFTGSLGLENQTRSLMTRMGVPYEDTLIAESVAAGNAMEGVLLIQRERLRQISEEGCTAEHDDAHTGYELSQAAAYYCIADDCHDSELVFPSTWGSVHMKRGGFPFPNIKDLTKAGALCAAEIDRLQRLQAKEVGHAA